VSFQDISGDRIPEIVSFEAEHGGTDDWQEYYHYYEVTPELSLKRVPLDRHPTAGCTARGLSWAKAGFV
jgi:hypothetical protein